MATKLKALSERAITDSNGEIRAIVRRVSLREITPVLVEVKSSLTTREARGLARAITAACDEHQRWKRSATTPTEGVTR